MECSDTGRQARQRWGQWAPMPDFALKVTFPAVLFIFAVSIIVQALQMSPALQDANAHQYPIVVAVVLALGALGSMLSAVRERVSPAAVDDAADSLGDVASSLSGEDEEAAADTGGRRRMLIVLAASLAYPLLMPVAGFHLTTLLYAIGVSMLLQAKTLRGLGWAAVTGIGVTVFCHVVFVLLLGARLPSGIF